MMEKFDQTKKIVRNRKIMMYYPNTNLKDIHGGN